jgi:NitT/TauT family transport system substrate-binding protein
LTSGSPAGSGRTVLTLHENFRAVFYAPFYAAFALDAFAAEGLEVRFEASDAPGPTARGRENGNGSDAPAIWWGGPMRILVARDADPNSDLVSFCEVVTRDPFIVVGRTPCSEFDFAALGGCRLGTVSEVPTPWMCLQDDIRRAGIEPTGLNLVTGRSMAENAQALRDGTLDAAQLFEPFVEELVASGAGHIWYAAASRGPTAYTSLYAARATLERDREAAIAVTRAIFRTQKRLQASSAREIAELVGAFFPNVGPVTLERAIARYKALGIWGRDPRLPRDGFERLRAACLSGGLIECGSAYEDCVDNGPAETAIAADGSGA